MSSVKSAEKNGSEGIDVDHYHMDKITGAKLKALEHLRTLAKSEVLVAAKKDSALITLANKIEDEFREQRLRKNESIETMRTVFLEEAMGDSLEQIKTVLVGVQEEILPAMRSDIADMQAETRWLDAENEARLWLDAHHIDAYHSSRSDQSSLTDAAIVKSKASVIDAAAPTQPIAKSPAPQPWETDNLDPHRRGVLGMDVIIEALGPPLRRQRPRSSSPEAAAATAMSALSGPLPVHAAMTVDETSSRSSDHDIQQPQPQSIAGGLNVSEQPLDSQSKNHMTDPPAIIEDWASRVLTKGLEM